MHGHVITKFSGMGRFSYPWCSAITIIFFFKRDAFFITQQIHKYCLLTLFRAGRLFEHPLAKTLNNSKTV